MERDWAELPSGLLSKIMNRLCISSIDSLKDVCRNWNSAVLEEVSLSLLKPLESPPWLSISPSSFFSVSNNKVYSLNKKKQNHVWRPPAVDMARCVGSSHGWLAYIGYLCQIYLTNPFKDIVVKLPSIETLPCIVGVYELSSSSLCINFKYWNASTDYVSVAPSTRMYNSFITKLVMSSPPSIDHCIVMVIFGDLCQIAFCKVGERSWTTLGLNQNYSDLYYSTNDHCFYALLRNTWSIEVWDLRDSSSPNILTSFQLSCPQLFQPSMARNEWCHCPNKEKFYLAQVHGELLLVVKFTGNVYKDGRVLIWRDEYHEFVKGEEEDDEVGEETEVNEESRLVDDEVNGGDSDEEEDDRDTSSEVVRENLPYKTYCFMVYKLDMVKKKWVLTTNGVGGGDGDSVLFLGINNAIAFSPIEFPQLKRNSIYFTDDKYTRIMHGSCSYGGHDLGIFSFEDYKIHPCYFSEDAIQILPPPVWISPNPW